MSDKDSSKAPAENMNESSDDVSAALATSTAPAGKELLQEQKLSLWNLLQAPTLVQPSTFCPVLAGGQKDDDCHGK